jgi:hypothetical protein
MTHGRPNGRQMVLLSAPVVGLVATLALWLATPPRLRRVGLPVAAAGAFAFEDKGVAGPPGGVAARAVSLLTTAIVGVAWSAGVWQELLRPSEPS